MNIVGVGNLLMGDDGVGPLALEPLRARGLPDTVRFYDAGLAVSDVLGMLDPAEPLLLIDAVRGGGPGGTIYKVRLDAGAADSCAGEGPTLSLHELSVVPALRLEAISGRVFSDVTVFGVEPAVVAWGEGLSPVVRAALDHLVEAVVDEVRARGTRVAPGCLPVCSSAAPRTLRGRKEGPAARSGP